MDELEQIRTRKREQLRERLSGQSAAPVVITDATFDEVVSRERVVLVDFWAAWCGPCHYVAPHVEAVAREFAGRVTVGKVNVDENPQTAGRFGVTSIPTLAVFRDGRLVDAIIGAVPREQIEALLRRCI